MIQEAVLALLMAVVVVAFWKGMRTSWLA
jgi:hypothetical protein